MTLWRCVRLRGGDALPGLLALLALAACSSSPSATSTAGPRASASPAPRSAARPAIPVHVGAVRIERPGRLVVRPAQGEPALAPGAQARAGARERAAHAPPRIFAINLSTLEIASGDTVGGTVETSADVAAVEARIGGFSMEVPRTRAGHFEAAGQLPEIPFVFKGTWTLQVIARNTDGAEVERDIPITVR